MTIAPRTLAAALLLVPALASTPAAAQFIDDGDVFVEAVDGRLETGQVISTTETQPERVFTSAPFEFSTINAAFTDDPGFQSIDLPGFSAIRIDFLDAPRVWNGQDFDDLANVAFILSRNQTDYPAPTTAGGTTEGPTLPVSEFGDMHIHPGQRFPLPLPDALYLLQYQLVSNAGIDPSDPIFVIYNWNRPTSEVDAAVAYVRNELLAPPCPADFNDDGLVSSADLSTLLANWGAADSGADLTDDGTVSAADLSTMLAAWGPCPE